MANSIAIFTDTAHLATDVLGFAMSMAALKISMRPASKDLTFGWHRAEIIGTLLSIIFLLTITIGLLYAAIMRVIKPQKVDGKIMLITACMCFCFNLIQMKILHQGDGHYHLGGEHGHSHDHGHGCSGHAHEGGHGEHDHGHEHSHDKKLKLHKQESSAQRNINVDAAFLHALGDMFMSIGVVVAAVVIYFEPTYLIADPLCTFLFSIIVCVTVRPIIKNCISVLMEGAPSEINTDKLIMEIREACGATENGIHDFHLWSISMGKFALSAHIDC